MESLHFENAAEAIETLRMATAATNLGVWDLDLLTGVLHWSKRCREIFGVPLEATLQYEDFLERLDAPDREDVHAAVQRALDPDGPGEYDIEYRVCRPSGETRWASAKGKAFFQGEGQERRPVRFMGTILDRTEQKLSQEALIDAERMAGTGRLAASIAHEINNPLEAVTNLLYLLRGEKDEQQREQYLSMAESELARVSEVASSTLQFHRDPAMEVPVHLPTLIHSVLSVFRGRIALNDIAVSCELEDETHLTSQGELRQVLVNLVGNALDAMPKGGRLRIRSRRRHVGADAQRSDVITVADTGTGMGAAVLERLFQPFYTTKGSKGTGIGLWLSRQMLEKRGFRIWVRSQTAVGTLFSVIMPL